MLMRMMTVMRMLNGDDDDNDKYDADDKENDDIDNDDVSVGADD